MDIRQVVPEDHTEWLRMRLLLWPESLAAHQHEMSEFFAHQNPATVTFVIERGRGRLGGFLEARVRNYAEGCVSARVGYIEGWYVDPDLRRHGLGRRLVYAAEQWARQLGLMEMASDCDIDNEVSVRAHTALGYTEVERIICLRKVLLIQPAPNLPQCTQQAPEILTTDRLTLRRPALTDAADVYAYAHDPAVTRYMVWPTHTEMSESIAFLESCGPRWEAGDEYCWVITITPEERAIGMIGCRVREYTADFGYVLHRAYWGRGYATEAARAVVTWLKSLPGIFRIWATCDAENRASVRVLEKTGLDCEGRLRRSTIRPNLSPTPRDTFVFAWVRDEEGCP